MERLQAQLAGLALVWW